jgi:hypothetical protein
MATFADMIAVVGPRRVLATAVATELLFRVDPTQAAFVSAV